MGVQNYDLDREVFQLLNAGRGQLEQWKGVASGIADYVASWGVERFWAMSRSPALLNGKMPDPNEGEEKSDLRRYFAWSVARATLCKIVGDDLKIQASMTTEEFQKQFNKLNFNEQILLTDLLIEISGTIQFWTMRINDAKDSEV
jgi:hypothetical protein